jgi:Mor family transcriptional regulator
MQRAVRELADAIGLGDAIEVCRRWGGREAYIPVKVSPGDPLALTLGLDTAQRLVSAFGGRRLQLPAERNALLDLRNAAILRDADAGMSQEQIGLRYGLTRQSISHILRQLRDTPEPRRTFAGVPVRAAS